MAVEENLALMRRFYLEGVNGRNWDVVDTLLAPDFTHNGQVRGVSGQRRALESLYAAFRDARVSIEEAIATEDHVVCRMTWSGLHSGSFHGIAATGKRVTWTAISIIRIVDGRITEAWVNEDDLGLLLQIGGRVETRHR